MSDGHAAHGGHGGHAPPSPEAGAHGPAELPPIPNPRCISPAREDFEAPWPGKLVAWPLVWIVVTLLLFVAARSFGHRIDAHEAEAHETEGGGEAPHGAEPAMGDAR